MRFSSDYSAFYQEESGILGWNADEKHEVALKRMVDYHIEHMRLANSVNRLHSNEQM